MLGRGNGDARERNAATNAETKMDEGYEPNNCKVHSVHQAHLPAC